MARPPTKTNTWSALTDATLTREFLATRLTFFGHTHIQGGFLVTRGGSKRIVPPGTIELEPDHYYLVNVGAVGQPRDGDPRAAYALYFPEQRTIEYCRADYDVASAAAKIRAAGLPGASGRAIVRVAPKAVRMET